MYKWVVGDLVFDKNRPHGNPRRLLDSRKISSIRFQQLSYRSKHFQSNLQLKVLGKINGEQGPLWMKDFGQLGIGIRE